MGASNGFGTGAGAGIGVGCGCLVFVLGMLVVSVVGLVFLFALGSSVQPPANTIPSVKTKATGKAEVMKPSKTNY